MVKKSFSIATLFFLLCIFMNVAFAGDDEAKHPSCTFCGMNRTHFAHSRMLVTYEDGTTTGTCSLHCLAIELALSIDKTPTGIQVGDYSSKKLIDGEKAFWIVGGEKPGVMTKRAKWAFEDKGDADNYIAANGGTLVSFDEAVKSAYEDMYSDTKMIRDKRKKMKSGAK